MHPTPQSDGGRPHRRPRVEDAFDRVTGASLVPGNAVTLLCDATENYPAWLASIERAERTIHLEQYIVRDDGIGRRFRELLVAKARAGVRVRVLYDWFGCFASARAGFFEPLVAAGAEVRVARPPRLRALLSLPSRDHRKLLVTDARDAFVSGLCIGDDWQGDPATGREPWRDTGVAVRGPAVADLEAAFAASWAREGAPLPSDAIPRRDRFAPAGPVALRVVATSPETAGLFRLDLLIAAAARERLWITDAYFMATTPYRQALCDAARDGVDVRLLLPHGSDIEWVARVSRTLYRPLLEAGVRIFEWDGPMLHAKCSVADGRWARVGSSNLNLASWIGNHELDLAIENVGFAEVLEERFERDLAGATEVVLRDAHAVLASPRSTRARDERPRAGSRSRALSNAAGVGGMIGSALRAPRVLDRAEASWIGGIGLALLVAALVGVAFPRIVSVLAALVLAPVGGALLLQAWLGRERGGEG